MQPTYNIQHTITPASKQVVQFNTTLFGTHKMSSPNLREATVTQFYSTRSPCIMESIDPLVNAPQLENNPSSDSHITAKLESLNITNEGYCSIPQTFADSRSSLLLDGDERLRVTSEENFLKRLKIGEDVQKVKVVSIFGNTGEGKSYTLNQVFFNGEHVFRTSSDQMSCTMGVWAAYDPGLKVICLDTEGLLGVTKKENQRTRLLLKTLAVSDVIIYRTKAERLQRDMYTFLGGASQAYKDHFDVALKQLKLSANLDQSVMAQSMGPSVIIFHETRHTNTLKSSVSESPEDILRSRFNELQLSIDGFSSLKYVGITSKGETPTSFAELRSAVRLELDNTTVRSARNPKFIYLTLKGLNEKFKSEITNATPQLYLPAYFTCQVKCQSCNAGCALSMGHVDEGKAHSSSTLCKFQHQFQNCIYLCKNCHTKGERVVVKPSYQSRTEQSWTNLFTYVWSGYVIECRICGEIFRSRQHWYGNKSPEEGAVLTDIVHVWPGDHSLLWAQNSGQKVVDGVSRLCEVVASVGSTPTNAITSWVNDKVAPSYWKSDHLLKHCHKCKTPFNSKASKHHCRACGEGFCEKCSSNYQPVPTRGWNCDVRVCDDCFQENQPNLPSEVDDAEVRARKYSEACVTSVSTVASLLNKPKKLFKDFVRPAYWTPDDECLNCECCGVRFGAVIPFHHCRDCGKGVCDDCSKNKKAVPLRGWDTPVRVCNKCAA